MKGVTLEFEGTEVLKSLDFELKSSEILAILGPTGCGKSVLLKLLVGLLAPTQGEIRYQGDLLSQKSPDERLAQARSLTMTFQNSGLFDSISCEENLRLPLRELTDLGPEEIAQRVKESLEEVGLGGVEQQRVYELSGGMQKRLGVARALCLHPDTVLLDDPTAGLDPITSRQIMEMIRETQARRKMSMVIVSADVARAMTVADRVAVILRGEFAQIGTPEEIKNKPVTAVSNFLKGIADDSL